MGTVCGFTILPNDKVQEYSNTPVGQYDTQWADDLWDDLSGVNLHPNKLPVGRSDAQWDKDLWDDLSGMRVSANKQRFKAAVKVRPSAAPPLAAAGPQC